MTGGDAAEWPALTVDARPENLDRLRDFVEQTLRGAGVPEAAVFDWLVVLDEVATNIVSHGYAGMPPGPLRVVVACEPSRVTLTIADRAQPFDPAQAPPPDLTSDWEARPIGGLGWHLVRHLTDELRYTTDPHGGNVLMLVKRLNRAAGDGGHPGIAGMT